MCRSRRQAGRLAGTDILDGPLPPPDGRRLIGGERANGNSTIRNDRENAGAESTSAPHGSRADEARRAPRRDRRPLDRPLRVSRAPGYTYLSHQASDGVVLYFKVPSNWSRFTFSSDEKSVNGQLSISQVSQIQGARWYVSFDAAPGAKPGLFLNELKSRHPTGIAFAARLNPTVRDSFSLAGMRSEILGIDPLSQSANSPFNVLSYSEFTSKGGIRGSKLVTDITDTGGITDTYAQIVDVDPSTNWVFAIAVACRGAAGGPTREASTRS